ncbi:DUF4222 domain-containing protein [Escherichia coli]|uniref:DUF4222 domain-containing protein n=1 Tax=Escherichia coli TaxID=562 RepID=UPI000D13D5EE|nr:DUF4222 domain-containing protein [Escherichia coli]EEU3019454.1 DUF4222 domain-containing protein [Escherichia coli]EEX5383260.1 DUF4222 domain-containing protein [Escherichia coli]EFK6851202.1 DUF4222 domain-containing protein [Escherichia coli]EFL3920740.1 DUF4222 domain-containing protein [Escherichia coli]EFM4168764.1 DUF4222 domain-containing protein [Escherichia coli]
MKKKNTGATASGLPRPEIIKGDIYLDGDGNYVTVTRVNSTFITFIRSGYLFENVMFRLQFEKDFTPLKEKKYCCDDSGTIAQHIAELRNQIARGRKGK